MSERTESFAQNRATIIALWALIALYAIARILQILPRRIPMLGVVALHVLPPALFALLHGAKVYGWRSIATFFALCLVIGNIFENLGVRTGFPFGHYYFTDVMGPKLFVVPILLGMAYLGMAYLSWILAGLILAGPPSAIEGSRTIGLPVVASFIMVAWDFSQDPIWSTILHAWIWRDGGPYFGVPLSNFLGWFLTVYVFYQLFALYLRRRQTLIHPLPSGYWRMPVLFYGISAAGNLLLAIPSAGARVVSDAGGTRWDVSDITAACALSSIFTMGAFALMAWFRMGAAVSEELQMSRPEERRMRSACAKSAQV
jgi:uncharacterized membrane protein